MIKQILPVVLAVGAAGSVNALGPQRVMPQGDQFRVVAQNIKAPKKIQTRADDSTPSIEFTLADEPYTAIGLSGTAPGDEIYMAFQISPSNAVKFEGNQVTAVNITTGATVINGRPYPNEVTDITVFITENLDAEPVYTQTGTLGTNYLTEYKINLDTPYTIESGKSFYIGYHFTLKNTDQAYMAVDAVLNNEDTGCLVGVKDAEGMEWYNFADQVGNLCMGCTISGDNLPKNGVSLLDFGGQLYAFPGKEYSYDFLIQGIGTQADNIEFTYQIGTGEIKTQTITLDTPLQYNKYAIVSLPGLVCNDIALDVPMNFTISKVNGEDNTSDKKTLITDICCYEASKGYPRVHLMEEGTGTWCGYCPLGIEMMKYLEEKYPDFFARVAIHANGSTREPMATTTGNTWVQAYATGFPCAIIDRWNSVEALQTASLTRLKSEIDNFVAVNKDVPAVIGIDDVTCSYDASGKVKVDCKVKCVFDVPTDNRFRMAYYLVQDNVGPYDQVNYYSTGQFGAMAGWQNKDEYVETMYDDVCRILAGNVRGYAGSLPAELVAGTEYETSMSISTKAVTSDDFRVVILVIDSKTGEIANAYQVNTSKTDSGVSDIEAGASVVAKTLYDLNGVEISEPASGLYIERTVYSDGTVKASKIIK